ncbi:MAG: RNA polymerase [Thalassobius sp.]|nr:RNA polymerase [Thalassovita sp.]
MSNQSHQIIESSYRAYYGKLFSALLNQFGVSYVNEIEDAIQNSFLKSLKSWKPNHFPDNRENWLYIVAKNDLVNQIKRSTKSSSATINSEIADNAKTDDLRLQTILLFSSSKKISTQTKVIFILKNIFGLNVREIAESTLLNQDAIYKSIKRAKKTLQTEFVDTQIDSINAGHNEIIIVEEILYAVFNIGFDSFNEKVKSMVNEDLCLEALSLAKLLSEKYTSDSTKNLMALFCFHIARLPAKIDNGKLIPFIKQDKSKWNLELFNLGFHFLRKPDKLDKFYLEALIISKYMGTNTYDTAHWEEIIKLYELLIKCYNSPIVKLNLCYALHKAHRTSEALALLEDLKYELPDNHIYLSLVKADILKETNTEEAEQILHSVLNNMNQSIRKEYILENGFIKL